MVGMINTGFYREYSHQHFLSVLMAFVNNFTEESFPGTWLRVTPVTTISRCCSVYTTPLLWHKDDVSFASHRARSLQ